MVRISDILKKALEKKEQEAQPPFQPAESMPKEDLSKAEAQFVNNSPPEIDRKIEGINKEEKKEAENNVSDIRISPLVAKKVSKEESVKLYEELTLLIKGTLNNISEQNFIDGNIIEDKIETLVSQLLLNNEYLQMLAFIKDSADSNYLLSHSVNVCIYSIEIGLGLDYEKNKLMELGIAAFLHDVGMEKYHDIAQSQKRLTNEEYKKMEEHSLLGLQILEHSGSNYKIASLVAYQHHERLDGSGYPLGKTGEAIIEYAKIVGLVDIYESMIHSRLYRQRKTLMEVVQEILNEKNKFEYKLIKVLMEKIEVFPVGSFVRLNNKEIAQVIKLNHGVPLRPVVKIILDPNGKQMQETKIIDLTAQPTVCIKGEEKINWDWVRL